ncbi:alpha/beta fold hydrolase [Methylocella sp.]|uniref:alpha/beta hydrolase family protein n=1 Tax=Methylocella sp. TaxID=1978226 RepID=UPI003783A794
MTQNAGATQAHEATTVVCRDGVALGGDLFRAMGGTAKGAVVVNAATGVAARYYHRYARFLAGHGFDVLTYDYRGIGRSRPERLRGCGFRWRDWGEKDFDAALRHARAASPNGPALVVGHSIGGFLPGMADSAPMIDRMLTVGAQYAFWPDYAARGRARLFLKWHVAMPALTAAFGYFPGRRLGWLEDLPSGVAYEWSFRGRRFERSHPAAEREAVLDRFRAVRGQILAVSLSDDDLGTPAATARGLAPYENAERILARLRPQDFGQAHIGHFSLFHDRNEAGFWTDSLAFLEDGRNPWPARAAPFAPSPARTRSAPRPA